MFNVQLDLTRDEFNVLMVALLETSHSYTTMIRSDRKNSVHLQKNVDILEGLVQKINTTATCNGG